MKVPRKLDPLIRFFKETISNDKVSLRTRMSAAVRLDDIYARHALMEEKAAARKERSELRATAQREPGGANAAQETASEANGLNEDEAISSVFGSLLRGRVGDADTDTAE